jgi:glycosyltransferase involved in cell wall biosynthesis
VRNGAAREKIVFCPQGIPTDILLHRSSQYNKPREEDGEFHIGYVGRIHYVKGVEIIVKAFRQLVAPRARLLICGARDEVGGLKYERSVFRLAECDSRIKIFLNLPHDQLTKIYHSFNVLAVPSIWPETGPLVVWEALSYGVPVLASNNIGHPQLLKEGKNGIIVEPNTVSNWAIVLNRVINGDIKFSGFNNQNLRTMDDVAKEMAEIYRQVNDNLNQ